MLNKILVLGAFSLLLLSAGNVLAADCTPDVSKQVTTTYCQVGDAPCWQSKGGYSEAYVQSRIAGAPTGIASSWTPNIKKDIKTVKAGDAAIFTVAGSTRGHVAYVEAVDILKNQFMVSEYNWGNCSVDSANGVNSNYHKKSSFPRKFSTKDPSLKGFWRK